MEQTSRYRLHFALFVAVFLAGFSHIYLTEILHYNGLPMNAQFVIDAVNEDMAKGEAA